jgi:chemotaxis methyl-accepting protein methylase
LNGALEQIAELVRRESGVCIGKSQHASLQLALRRIDPGASAEDFLGALDAGDGALDLLAHLIDEVTVKETFFFRQRAELDAIDWNALLEGAVASGSDTVRVWVAACATGEEAYTLAVLASEALGTARPPVSVLGTDISPSALASAVEGHYTRRSVSLIPTDIRARYFFGSGHDLHVRPELREPVAFERHNVVRDPAPPPGQERFDLIVCRNLLIYFDGPTVERVIKSFERSLRPHGMLVLGAADRLCASVRALSKLAPVQVNPPRSWHHAERKPLRLPLGLEANDDQPEDDEMAVAIDAANQGRIEAALDATNGVLRRDPLNADAYFIRGLAELDSGDADAAVRSFRRALYVDPRLGLAAFKLGRAHELAGRQLAARRAYEQALRLIERDDFHQPGAGALDAGDVAAACRARISALRASAIRLAG